MERLISVFGLFSMMGLAFLLSNNKRKIKLRTVIGGLVIQLVLAAFMLKTRIGVALFQKLQTAIEGLLALSNKGAAFVFGDAFSHHFFAFSVLPTIIFVASITSVLFYVGILQKIVEAFAKVMCKIMGTAGSESLAAAAEIFVGQTESPLFIRPYLNTMTRSELLAMMTAGMCTVAGGVLAAYVGLGISAGHLLTASVMGAPAALVIAKLILPETEPSETMGTVKCRIERQAENLFDAACQGAAEGVKLAINVGAMLIAFISLIALANVILRYLGGWVHLSVTLEQIFGWICSPLAFLMGVPWSEAGQVGQLLGEKAVLNEFVAYIHLGKIQASQTPLSPRASAIATYALCGFANFASIAIQIGGISSLAPDRRKDFAQLGVRAFLGGNLATFMNACIAGLLL